MDKYGWGTGEQRRREKEKISKEEKSKVRIERSKIIKEGSRATSR